MNSIELCFSLMFPKYTVKFGLFWYFVSLCSKIPDNQGFSVVSKPTLGQVMFATIPKTCLEVGDELQSVFERDHDQRAKLTREQRIDTVKQPLHQQQRHLLLSRYQVFPGVPVGQHYLRTLHQPPVIQGLISDLKRLDCSFQKTAANLFQDCQLQKNIFVDNAFIRVQCYSIVCSQYSTVNIFLGLQEFWEESNSVWRVCPLVNNHTHKIVRDCCNV